MTPLSGTKKSIYANSWKWPYYSSTFGTAWNLFGDGYNTGTGGGLTKTFPLKKKRMPTKGTYAIFKTVRFGRFFVIDNQPVS